MIELETLTQIITVLVGVFTFYGLVTRPLANSINLLRNELHEMHRDYINTTQQVAKINESLKSAHKRIDKLEDKH